jgi:hypothetical protein
VSRSYAERGARGTGSSSKAFTETPSSANSTRRFGEDADELLDEVERILDNADLVILDALDGGSFTSRDALENVLRVHGRIRRNLSAVRVGV